MVILPRLPRSSLSQLFTVLAVVLVVDLLVASAVFIDRLDDPDVPDFRRTSVAGIDWTVSPYQEPSEILGFRTDVSPRQRAEFPDRAARFVIGAVARFETTSEQRWLRRAEDAMADILRDSDEGLIAHRYKATDLLGRPIPSPWYAADTQGVVLSALARLYEATGDGRWRSAAGPVFDALGSFQGFFAGGRPAPETWLSIVDSRGYVWFDRFSTGLTSTQVLTEQLWTMLGVYDFRRILADRAVERRKSNALLGGSLATVEHYLKMWRQPGRISVSSISVGNRDVREHFVAAEQLRIVASITGMDWALEAADAYDRDRNVPYFALKPLETPPVPDALGSPMELARLLALVGRPPSIDERGTPRRLPLSTSRDPLQTLAVAASLLDRSATPDEVDRARELVARVISTLERGLVPHPAPTTDAAGEVVRDTWYSAATQGMLLSALTRLNRHDKDARWAQAADDAFDALTRVRDYGPPTSRPYLGLIDFSGYLWFDHNLGARPPLRSTVEHVVALVGLHDYYAMTGRGDVYAFFAGGVTTLRDALPFLRRPGDVVVAHLTTGRGDRRHHRIVMEGVKSLAGSTGDATLIKFGRLLRKDYR